VSFLGGNREKLSGMGNSYGCPGADDGVCKDARTKSTSKGCAQMDNEVQLQSKVFNTATRPRLTTERREPTAYEIACLNLDRAHGVVKPAPASSEAIDVEDFVDCPDEMALSDGSFRLRAKLVEVTRRGDLSWYEIRVGRRHRFTYKSVKAAARAFVQLTAENLQPTGWASSNGGQREAPVAPMSHGILRHLPRFLGWDLSPSL
jgi:hypothetical protein